MLLMSRYLLANEGRSFNAISTISFIHLFDMKPLACESLFRRISSPVFIVYGTSLKIWKEIAKYKVHESDTENVECKNHILEKFNLFSFQ